MTVLTLIGKPDCHLCEDALTVVEGVLADYPAVELEQLSILDDPVLMEKYVEEIPVLLIDGTVHNIWRVNETRLRTALEETSR